MLILFCLGHRIGRLVQVAVELNEVFGGANGDLLEDVSGLAWAKGGVEKVVDGV
jgi:hypothetical protein